MASPTDPTASSTDGPAIALPDHNRRALVVLAAVLAVAAAFFLVTHVVMKPKPIANPVAPMLAQPAKARAVVAAQNAASAKLGAATGGVPTTTVTAPPVPAAAKGGKPAPVQTGPAPNLTRNPFLP